mmetsp:Transcript_89037/g.256704  ORF Transcript_89037/g.256704 Transcript_89037/m.256704 type:complete len:274 (-) Transcript_89037:35-856(-)
MSGDAWPNTSSTNSELSPRAIIAFMLETETPLSCLHVTETTASLGKDSNNTSPGLTCSCGGTGWISSMTSSEVVLPVTSKLTSFVFSDSKPPPRSMSAGASGLVASSGLGCGSTQTIGMWRAAWAWEALSGLGFGSASPLGILVRPRAWAFGAVGSCDPLLRSLSKLAWCAPSSSSVSATFIPTKRDSAVTCSAVIRWSPCSRTCLKRPPLLPGRILGPRMTMNKMPAKPTGSDTKPGSTMPKGWRPFCTSRPFTSKLVLVPMVVSKPPIIEE